MGEPVKEGAGPSGQDRLGSAKARVDKAGSLFTELEGARKAGRRARALIVVVILVVALGFAWSLYRVVADFEKAKFVAKIQSEMPRIITNVTQKVTDMSKGLYETYLTEIKKQMTQEWPAMRQKLEGEAQLLLKNLSEQAGKKVTKRIDEAKERVTGKFVQAFPELTDEKKQELVLKNLKDALSSAFVDVMNKRVTMGASRVTMLFDKILQFLPKDKQQEFKTNVEGWWDELAKYVAPKEEKK